MVSPSHLASILFPAPPRAIETLIARGLCLCVVLGTLIRYLGRWNWLCEITTHFVVQATVLASIATLLLLVRRHWRLCAVAAILTLVNAAEWVPYYSLQSLTSQAYKADETLIVVSTNVYSRNRNSADLHQWLSDTQADVVFVSEVDGWWAKQLDSWKAEWPHQILEPRQDNFGLALLSRFPIKSSQVFDLDGAIPAVEARIETPSGEWSIVGLHPLPPSGPNNSRLRNQQLATAAQHISALAKPRVVLGDFNSTSSSPVFRDFLQATGLTDSRYGRGWQPTWPARSRLLRIPIDHCLVEPSLRVIDRSVGPKIGSDHLPLRARLSR